ncbi:MAG: hypothetical protein D4R45_07285 [Planctomycetaceae bacterium]|nr:MAG: hypothetical protein D4R45_07285 [Planctomycetaceae bacterium]
MARDNTTQRMGGGFGLRIDAGTYDFSGSAVTVELPTCLSTVLSFLGVIEDDNVTVKSDRTVTSGAITVARATGGTSGAGFSYVALGY